MIFFFRSFQTEQLKPVSNSKITKYKTIYSGDIPSYLNVSEGIGEFKNCPVVSCRITTNKHELETADLVWFHEQYTHIEYKRPEKQIYAFFSVESPMMRPNHFNPPDTINWTITYRYY